MTISQIYQKYKIMPSLQQHQLGVAAVAKLICKNLHSDLDVKAVTSACLLHDMGNILKFDLSLFPKFLEPEGLDYWQGVKEEFKDNYGADEHFANIQIAREIGVNQKILDLINAIGFENIEEHFLAGDLEKIICEYADCRVAPRGVVSLEERLEDLEERYGPKYSSEKQKAKRQKFYELERKSEAYIFEDLEIEPGDIGEKSVNALIKELKAHEI